MPVSLAHARKLRVGRWNSQHSAGRSCTGGRPPSGPVTPRGRLLVEGGGFRWVKLRRARAPVEAQVLGLETRGLRIGRNRLGHREHRDRRRADRYRLALHDGALFGTIAICAVTGCVIRSASERHRHFALHRRHRGSLHPLQPQRQDEREGREPGNKSAEERRSHSKRTIRLAALLVERVPRAASRQHETRGRPHANVIAPDAPAFNQRPTRAR